MLCRVYHFNYVARFQDGTSNVDVQGQQYNGTAWSATFNQPLYAWTDGESIRRFVAWSTEILMTAGDKFRIANPPAGVNTTFRFQQMSGYFVGAAPLGAQATYSSHSFVAGTSMFGGTVTTGYDNVGGCGAAGLTSTGYKAPRSGLYQLQVRNHNDCMLLTP